MNSNPLESLLQRLEDDPEQDLARTLRQIVDWLRPEEDRGNIAQVIARIERLVLALADHPELRARLRSHLEQGLEEARHLTLYASGPCGRPGRRGWATQLA
ncbi:MAG: hypothetical protein EA347_09335 [Thioalkalivibrio sp.]|nr:MAG: hypothetical protein EA347_09335 [Thioalkalivibrio sp.]